MASSNPPSAPGDTSASPAQVRRVVPCPNCRQPTLFAAENPYRPFCSARCQGHDFGSWANEDYRVGAQPPVEDRQE